MKLDPKARVFISCGQRKGESNIARNIYWLLNRMGYDPYLAIDQSEPTGLKESIFRQFENTEYFLFVDFKREQCISIEGNVFYRGSLFTHQELAIAAYLDIDILSFREKGVGLHEGVANALHLKRNTFSTQDELLRLVEYQVNEHWNPNWKNGLKLYYAPEMYEDVLASDEKARFFHIQVENMHIKRAARNCIASITNIVDLKTGEDLKYLSSELKWAGYTNPNVNILPGNRRELDAFYVYHDTPTVVNFNAFTSSGLYMHPLTIPGRYELRYTIISDNMPIASSKFRITTKKTMRGIMFKHME